MRNKIAIYVLLPFILFGSCKTKKLTLADPRESIESAIIDCISLLENKEYEALLSKYVYPDDLEKILKDKSMDELIKSFSKGKAERLLKALKFAKTQEIEYKENNTVGVIQLGEGFKGPDEIVFIKKDKLWYIGD